MSTNCRTRFGTPVCALRKAKGFSQEALAEVCSLHRTYIGSIKRGERNISIDSMERVAGALAVDLRDLLLLQPDAVAGRCASIASKTGAP